MITIKRFGTVYSENGKCPSCSVEKDKGGRLVSLKRKRWYLKCDKCGYSVISEKTTMSRIEYGKKHNDKVLFKGSKRRHFKEIKHKRAEQLLPDL